jgi:hypothetical protein
MAKKTIHNKISESQVEESLVTNLNYIRKLLSLPSEIKLIARQLRLRSGKQIIDLLLSHGKNLILIELKINPYNEDFKKQVLEYKQELEILQQNEKLIAGEIIAYLFVTSASQSQITMAIKQNVKVIIYHPLDVLNEYYKNLSIAASFLRVKPNDYGVYNIGLIHRVLKEVSSGETRQAKIALNLGLSRSSVHNHLRLGKEFGLIRERNKNYFLTDIGDKYSEEISDNVLMDELSLNQMEILKNFISKDPFYSSSVFGIYSIVESAFLLSRNVYPISLKELRKMFQKVSGKTTEWKSERALNTATYTFLNYSIDLDLLGKIGDQIVITPSGFRFILMLQLYKSIEMIHGLKR